MKTYFHIFIKFYYRNIQINIEDTPIAFEFRQLGILLTKLLMEIM